MLRDYPVTPYTRLPIKFSHKTAMCGNMRQSTIFYQVIEFYQILLSCYGITL